MAEAATITTEQEPAICIDAAKWGAAMMRWRLADLRAKTEWSAYLAMSDNDPNARTMAELTEQSGDAEGVAHDVLMEEIPAPDLSALRWKLDQLFRPDQEDEECMLAWTYDHIRQTIADYRRLLPETV